MSVDLGLIERVIKRQRKEVLVRTEAVEAANLLALELLEKGKICDFLRDFPIALEKISFELRVDTGMSKAKRS